jgi:DNA-binding MarR family transcriptional regulator
MRVDTDPAEVAAALQVSIGLFVRRTRQSPVHDELSVPELAALSRLDRQGPATASDLARAEQITPQGMGATLNGLARRGLVDREPDPGDGRRSFIALTEAGRQVVRDKRSARTRQLAQVLSEAFTSREREVLAAAAPLIARLGESL